MSQALDTSAWILPLQSAQAASPVHGLEQAGGKGANLARLSLAGFPVPDGFLVTTQAYQDFVAANDLSGPILAALPPEADTDQLEAASARIRSLFAQAHMLHGLAEDLVRSYERLGAPPVAVRSSATAEDLPEMSFAGQQDTYLNVVGNDALLKAIVDCWASLWTARAIGYRMRNGVPQAGVALAVVVQRMVESQASGVLFTANPLTGLRSEMVIDATLGLGEALVSGKVEPDHYVVNTARGQIVEKRLGAKAMSIHGVAGGGTAVVEVARQDRQALADEQILALARLGEQVAGLYGSPQDIEWAWANGCLYLLQARAITSLYPTPPGLPAEPLKVLFSFGAVQGLLDPITPLGRDTLQTVFAMGAGLFGIRITAETQQVLLTAGERLWINVTALFRNSVGRRVMRAGLGLVEPTLKQALITLWDEPRLQPERRGIRPHALHRLAGFFLPLAGNILLNILSPRRRREYIVGNGEHLLTVMRSRCEGLAGPPRERLAQIADLLPHLAERELPRTFSLFVSAVAAGMATFNAVRVLTKDQAGEADGAWNDRVLELTRGLPHNPTTEMDLDLWRVARAIQSDTMLRAEFQHHDAREMARRYRSGEIPSPGKTLIGQFLDCYGGRGLGEIDLGRPRWREDPTPVFEMLSSYVQIERSDMTPDVIFARGEREAQAALEQLCASVRHTFGGWLKVRLVRFFAGRMRELMGVRESPKFFAVRLFGLLRTALLRAGADLVQLGDLQLPDDLTYLTYGEMRAFASGAPRNWKQLIAHRREASQREMMRRQVPRVLLSDGRALYEGIASTSAAGNVLNGSPVSPGRAEGNVRVVLNPHEAHLKPGEILVCPGTDPSWTPLFLSSGGLVMEVGGMMTHGAVVAREYGIPAIVGVDQATRRLVTGQRIRIDGSSGVIELLDAT